MCLTMFGSRGDVFASAGGCLFQVRLAHLLEFWRPPFEKCVGRLSTLGLQRNTPSVGTLYAIHWFSFVLSCS